MQTTNETVSTKLDLNIDYAKIEIRAAREALAAAKNKAMLVTLAVSIGVLKSKSSNAAKTIRVEPLRAAIEDAIRTAEQADEAAAEIAEVFAAHGVKGIVATDGTVIAEFAPRMLPGETPYTPEEQKKLAGLVSDAARADVSERDEVEGRVSLFTTRERKRVTLTAEQRANKLARNRRRHKRAIARERHGWANGQRTIRGAA